MVPFEPGTKKRKVKADSDSEDDVDLEKAIESTKASKKQTKNQKDTSDNEEEEDDKSSEYKKLQYKKLGRFYVADEVRKEHKHAVLTAAAYHSETHILVVGFSCGAFYLYEMPDVNMIHSLRYF